MAQFDPHANLIDSINTVFFQPCVAEVRIPKAGKMGTVSGYFELPDHRDEMVAAVEQFSGKHNIYWTINPCHTDLLARACNRVKPYQINTTEDAAILKRHWLPIDVDPVRFAGISSSNEEKEEAKLVMNDMRYWLTTHGWPSPVRATSGNGYHLLYRIDLPNDEPSTELVKSVLAALGLKFDNDEAHVDGTLYNASRILKAYGSVATKGDSTPTRPHRFAGLVVPTEPIRAVSVGQLQALAELAPKADRSIITGQGGWTKELVAKAFLAAKIAVRHPLPYQGGLKWQHDCWSNPDHKSPDAFTVLDRQGWVSYRCSHTTCGKGLNSKEWVSTLETMSGQQITRPSVYRRSLDEVKEKWRMEEYEIENGDR